MPAENQAAEATKDVGLTKDDVQKMIGDALKPVTDAQGEITKSLTSINDSIKSLSKPAAETDSKKKEEAPAITLESIGQLIDSKLQANNQAGQSKAARDAFIAEKMKEVPAAYRNQLGNDPAKWASEEQTIREQWKNDLKAAGAEPKNLGNAASEGGKTPEKTTVDRSKMSAHELLNSDN